jgi:hypothetical protein
MADLPDDAARAQFLLDANLLSAWYVEFETRQMSSEKLRGCLRYLFEQDGGPAYWKLSREGWNDLDLQRRHRGLRFLEIVDEEYDTVVAGRD